METSEAYDDYLALLSGIGAQLARVRIQRGYSQREVAERAGKSQALVAKVERRPARDTSFRCIYEVCRALPVSMGDVVTQAERELSLYEIARAPSEVTKRMQAITERLNALPEEEQVWMANMIEGLLERTRAPQVARRSIEATEAF